MTHGWSMSEVKKRFHLYCEIGCQKHVMAMYQGKMEKGCCMCEPTPECGWPDKDKYENESNNAWVESIEERIDMRWAEFRAGKGPFDTQAELERWEEDQRRKIKSIKEETNG